MWVIHCARLNIQKFHRVFAKVYLFRDIEITSSTMIEDGGSRICLSSSWFHNSFFCETKIIPSLERSFKQKRHLICLFFSFFFLVSFYGGEQKKLIGYQKEVVHAVLFVSARFSFEYLSGVSKKTLTRDLLTSLFPSPLYKSVVPSGGQNVPKRVKRMINTTFSEKKKFLITP